MTTAKLNFDGLRALPAQPVNGHAGSAASELWQEITACVQGMFVRVSNPTCELPAHLRQDLGLN